MTASNPPPALFAHTAISTGSKIIVWGGNNSLTTLAPSGGYVLDLATNAWSALSGTGGPTARRSHTAVWTGQTMIIWGGLINDSTGATTNDGGIYNPQTATWTAIPAFGLTARAGHVAVWTGTEMIVWGGFDSANNALGDGGIYNPATNAWRAMSSTGAPSARKHPVAIWTGSKMLIWGGANADGSVPVGDGAYYDPVADKWTPLTQTTPPSPRQWMSFDLAPVNNALYIFGGFTTGAVGSGYTLDLGSGLWSAISTTGAPSARYGHSQVMTSQGMVIWGGTDGTNVFQDGAIYY